MRDFLDAILAFIGSSSLTDDEFDALTISSYGYDQETYEALAAVLEGRSASSTLTDRLKYFFLSKGVEVAEAETEARSNIYIGDALC